MRALVALLLVACGRPEELPIARELVVAAPSASSAPSPSLPPSPAVVQELPKTVSPVSGAAFAAAVSVEASSGRIALVDAAGGKTFVTDGPADTEPTFAPHRRALAFVRVRSENHHDLYVLAAGGAPRLVLEGRPAPAEMDAERCLLDINQPFFSPDGTTIFFQTSAWATSWAAHALDLVSGKERFLYDGATQEVLPNGNLVANHFRLVWNKAGESEGRQEVWTLNDPDGKELRTLPTNALARRKVLASL